MIEISTISAAVISGVKVSYTLSVLLINGDYGYKFVLIFHLSSDVTGHMSVKPELTQSEF